MQRVSSFLKASVIFFSSGGMIIKRRMVSRYIPFQFHFTRRFQKHLSINLNKEMVSSFSNASQPVKIIKDAFRRLTCKCKAFFRSWDHGIVTCVYGRFALLTSPKDTK